MSTTEDLFSALVAFVVEELKKSGGRQLVNVELQHAPAGYRAESLASWDRSDDPALFEDLGRVEGLVTDIIKRAEEDADSYGSGVHRYMLLTRTMLGGRNRKSFSIAATFTNEGATQLAITEGGEGPAARGGDGGAIGLFMPAFTQQMRHNQQIMNINGSMFKGTLDVMVETVTSLRKDLAERDATIAMLTKRTSDAESEADQRTIEAMKQQSSDKRKDQIFAKIVPLIPIMVSRFISSAGGKDDAGGKQKGLLLVLTEIVKSIQSTPGQIEKIAAALSMPQQMLFGEMFRMISTMTPLTPAEPEEKSLEKPAPSAAPSA